MLCSMTSRRGQMLHVHAAQSYSSSATCAACAAERTWQRKTWGSQCVHSCAEPLGQTASIGVRLLLRILDRPQQMHILENDQTRNAGYSLCKLRKPSGVQPAYRAATAA